MQNFQDIFEKLKKSEIKIRLILNHPSSQENGGKVLS